MKKIPLIVVAGATASGKTALAIKLAKDSTEEIKKAGYNVTMEEIDTGNVYQIIIKVQK